MTSENLGRKSYLLNLLAFAALALWVGSVSFLRHFLGMFFSSYQEHLPTWFPASFSLVQFILIVIPLLPAALFWRSAPYRTISQSWLLAAVFILMALPVSLTRPTSAMLQAILHILTAGLFVGVLLLIDRLRRKRQRVTGETVSTEFSSYNAGLARTMMHNKVLSALVLGALLGFPWLAWGALGSLWDTFLQLGAALLMGIAAGRLLDFFLFSQTLSPGGKRGASIIHTGFGASVTLVIFASATGFGYSTMQVLLMATLASSGWLLAGLYNLGLKLNPPRNWMPLALMIGLIFAWPMVFVDADELAIIISISPGEILQWASYAAMVTIAINALVGTVLFFSRRWLADFSFGNSHTTSPLLVAIVLLGWFGGAMVYLLSGQPGLYGERIFVILKDQADLSQAANIPDIHARRQYVYQTLVEHADASQASIRRQLDQLQVQYKPYYLVNGLEVTGDPLLKAFLASRQDVDRILDNPMLRPLPAVPPVEPGNLPAPTPPTWNLSLIQADKVWQELGITGQGIVIGQTDSGVQGDHAELANSYRGRQHEGQVEDSYNWFDPWYGTTSPVEHQGHGTETLGVILGKTVGVAPGATWFACANLARNLGNPAFYLDCMQFMLAPFPPGGNPFTDGDPNRSADVVNNSWGCPQIEGCDPGSLRAAAYALRAAGIFQAVSAGNDGPLCATISDPLSLYREVFTVGAIDPRSNLSLFSSLGPVTADGSQRVKPDIVAPGESVVTSAPGGKYASVAGTSFAGPHVAGVVALMWSANPGLVGDIDRTEQILKETARPYEGTLPICSSAQDKPSTAVGYGIVDAYAAVQAARASQR